MIQVKAHRDRRQHTASTQEHLLENDMKTIRRATRWGAILLGLGLLGAMTLAQAANSNLPKSPVSYHPDVRITFRTNIGPKGMTFVGVGNGIDGVDNPTLQVAQGAVVQVTLIDGDGAEHNI